MSRAIVTRVIYVRGTALKWQKTAVTRLAEYTLQNNIAPDVLRRWEKEAFEMVATRRYSTCGILGKIGSFFLDSFNVGEEITLSRQPN